MDVSNLPIEKSKMQFLSKQKMSFSRRKKNHISISFFQDVDLKKAHEELKQLGLAQETTVPSSPPPIATKNIRGRPARPTEHSPIKPQKNKPGPKPKLKG